jgi:hypothetical protein
MNKALLGQLEEIWPKPWHLKHWILEVLGASWKIPLPLSSLGIWEIKGLGLRGGAPNMELLLPGWDLEGVLRVSW